MTEVSHETFQQTGEWFIELLERKDPHRTVTARQIIRNNMMKVQRYDTSIRHGEGSHAAQEGCGELANPEGDGGYQGDACEHAGDDGQPKTIAEWFRDAYRSPVFYVELAALGVCIIGCSLGVIEIWAIRG